MSQGRLSTTSLPGRCSRARDPHGNTSLGDQVEAKRAAGMRRKSQRILPAIVGLQDWTHEHDCSRATGSQEDWSAFGAAACWWNILPHAVSVRPRNFDSFIILRLQFVHEATHDGWAASSNAVGHQRTGAALGSDVPNRPSDSGVDRRLDISNIESVFFFFSFLLSFPQSSCWADGNR